MLKFNNKVLNINGNWLNPNGAPVDPYNPLGLPPRTVRVRTNDGKVPIKSSGATYETSTHVPGTTNVYDVFKDSESFESLLEGSNNVLEVLGANTTGITNMYSMFKGCILLSTVPLFDTSSVNSMRYMFYECYKLTYIPLFDTSNVTNMSRMFYYCTLLTNIPLFNTSKVTNMEGMFYACSSLTNVSLFNTSNVTNMGSMFEYCSSLSTVLLFDTSKVTDMLRMFYNCKLVQSGALALYQQASTQTTPPSSHSQTFYNCGSNTQTGAAELVQIPSDWK